MWTRTTHYTLYAVVEVDSRGRVTQQILIRLVYITKLLSDTEKNPFFFYYIFQVADAADYEVELYLNLLHNNSSLYIVVMETYDHKDIYFRSSLTSPGDPRNTGILWRVS